MLTLSSQLLSPPRHAPRTIATHGRLARHSPCLFVGFADAPMARRALEDGTGTSSTALIAARGTHSHHCSQALARGKGWQGVLRPQGRKAARLRGRPRGCDTARRRCGTPARLGQKAATLQAVSLLVCEAASAQGRAGRARSGMRIRHTPSVLNRDSTFYCAKLGRVIQQLFAMPS